MCVPFVTKTLGDPHSHCGVGKYQLYLELQYLDPYIDLWV